jgi:hypothetical protein
LRAAEGVVPGRVQRGVGSWYAEAWHGGTGYLVPCAGQNGMLQPGGMQGIEGRQSKDELDHKVGLGGGHLPVQVGSSERRGRHDEAGKATSGASECYLGVEALEGMLHTY